MQENATPALRVSSTGVGEISSQPPVDGDSFGWGHNERERYRVRYALNSDPPQISPWDVDIKVDETEYAARYCPSPTWGVPSPDNHSWGTPLPENTAWGAVLPQDSSSGPADVEMAGNVAVVEDGEAEEDGDERVERKVDVYEDVKATEDVHGCDSLTPLQRDPWGARQSYPGERDEKMWEGGWGSSGSVTWVRALPYSLDLFSLTCHFRAVLSRSPPPPHTRTWSPEI